MRPSKKIVAVLAWLLAAVGLAFVHFNHGEERILMDKAGRLQAQAQACEAQGNLAEAVKLYGDATILISAERMPAERAGLEWRLARARIKLGEIDPAVRGLQEALAMVPKTPGREPLEREIRYSLAEASYYAAWILRLENQPRPKWFPYAESARQHLRVLAEDARLPQETRTLHAKDMEATIRLARMDIEELKKLPIPEQAQPGARKGMSKDGQKGEGEEEGEGEQEGQGQPKGKKPGPGAGLNERPPDKGS